MRTLLLSLLALFLIGCQDLSPPDADPTVTFESTNGAPFTYAPRQVDEGKCGVDQEGVRVKLTKQRYQPSVDLGRELKVTILEGDSVEVHAPCYDLPLDEGQTVILSTESGDTILHKVCGIYIPPCPLR
jgi:hypothetical protein